MQLSLKINATFSLCYCNRTCPSDHIARAQDADIPDKLRMLFAYISADVYEMIEDCADYQTALSKLKRVYVKSPNTIFASHALVIRKQNPEESLQTFLNELLVLSKACNFQDVTAEVYRNELVRDAFA